MLAGARAEAEAAYLIDFHLKDSENWAVIHDLRLEHNGRVAQIDHLLIWSGLDVYVVESKGFRSKIRITGDRWEVLRDNHWTGIPSPVAQNERHILVLKELISASDWAPTFFGGFKQPIRYINVVAVPPECSVRGDDPNVMVVSMDNLVKTARSDRAWLAANVLSGIPSDELCDFGLHLADCHRPATFDFAAKFGVSLEPAEANPAKPVNGRPATTCTACGGVLTKAEAFFCRMNKDRFASQLLCRKCQQFAPKAQPEPLRTGATVLNDAVSSPVAPALAPGPRCADCGSPVEDKVAAFCRFNRRRFGAKTVCRGCQSRYPA